MLLLSIQLLRTNRIELGILPNTLMVGISYDKPHVFVALGPIRKGDFIIIAARPETGKTTFTASEASYMMTPNEMGDQSESNKNPKEELDDENDSSRK